MTSTRLNMQRRSYNGLALLLVISLLAGGAIYPVHGGLMDFGPPGMMQYGTCAQPKSNEDFKFEQFNSLWYQVEMVPNSYMEAKKCITIHFMWNGDAFNVTTHGLNEYNEEAVQVATISKVEPEDPVTMKPYLQIWAPGVPPVPYHVIETDYHNFACVYSCYELFSLMFEAFSVLSRRPEIRRDSLTACHRSFGKMELDLSRLQPVQQTGECSVYQQIVEGSGESLDLLDDDDENTLAEFTRGNLRPQVDNTMMEMEEDDEGREGGQEDEQGRGQGGIEISPSTSKTNQGTTNTDLYDASIKSSVKNKNKPPRARPNKEGRKVSEEGNWSQEEDEENFSFYSVYREEKIQRDDEMFEGEEHTVTVSQRKPPGSREKQEEGESGSAPTPTPTLLLLIIFAPLLWFRD